MLWLAVTPDKLELPVFVERSPAELAKKAGTTENNVRSQASRHHTACIKHKSGRRGGYRFYKVEE